MTGSQPRPRPKVVELDREELRRVRGGSSYAVGRSPLDFVKQLVIVDTQTHFGA